MEDRELVELLNEADSGCHCTYVDYPHRKWNCTDGISVRLSSELLRRRREGIPLPDGIDV